MQILYRTQIGKLQIRWLQPNEQTPVMRTLYNLSDEINRKLIREVKRMEEQ